MGRFLPAAATVAILCAATAAADTVVVDIDGFLSDYTTIQDGLDAVSDGDTVYVYPGMNPPNVYRGPRNRGLQFGGKNITLETLAAGPGDVVIDCEGLDRAFNLSTAVDSTSRIAGFMIRNGQRADEGGALRAAGALPVITECIFRNNRGSDGGAVWAGAGPCRIRRCDFYDNTATGEGGAVFLNASDAVIRHCVFHANDAVDHGAVAVVGAAPIVSNCSFTRNSGESTACLGIEGAGGLIERCVLAFSSLGSCVTAPSPEIVHCCVFGNEGGNELPGNVHDCMDGVDPRLCSLEAGNLDLCSNSNCLPTNNMWHIQIGARAQGCGECDSPASGSSWGAVKALFR
ncbi:MAG: right-handed parallel beta-helix repeat-containing protein [Candidatus Eisenbacteria bacterium]|nr:right-handed parallel beta-helix repeat-containing protein [Candidatus Eisenbacteria bacterium]